MQQLIDPDIVDKVLLFLAVAGPLIGLVMGLFLGAHDRRAISKIVGGTLLGGLGTLIYGLWRVYGLITDALGLDSLLNLGLQLLMFAVIGVGIGVAILKVSLLLKGSGRAHSR